jgi:hypothetical protein
MAPFSLTWVREPLLTTIGRRPDRAFLQDACVGFALYESTELVEIGE